MMSSRKNVLVVEDERVVAKDLQASLSALGYDVPSICASADDALRSATERCPDLVLMDIRIRDERDGIDAADILRSRFDVPVVYLTACAEDATIARAKGTEPHEYLVKPVKAEELRSTVEIALYKHATERRLRERERLFSTTLRSIGDGVVSTDAHGCITFMNSMAEALTGWHAPDATGRPLAEVLHLIDQRTKVPIENPIATVLQGGRSVHIDANLAPREGTPREVADSVAPIVDDSGEVVGAVLVFRDVSKQKSLERQLEQAERLASLGTLAAGVAHEINNPLTFLIGNLDFAVALLWQHRDASIAASWTDEMDAALAEAKIGAVRIAKIVADLRSFARPAVHEAGRANVRQALDCAIVMAGYELRQKALVVTDFKDVPFVLGDETRLEQVFLKLLVNAAHALRSDRPQDNEVRVSAAVDTEGRVVVEVRDNGCGMSDDMMRKIFDPFFTTKGIGKGTGLGLSIAHGIVTSLGGQIQVESRVGKGSVFRVVLPAAPERGPGLELSIVDAGLHQEGNVLVIDDEPEVLDAIIRMLAGEHVMTAAKGAEEALELLRAGRRFDLIICDLMMPGLTAMDLHEELLRIAPDQARRIVVVSGGAFTDRAIEFLQSVPNPSIEKPFNPPDFRKRVRELLSHLGTTTERT